MEAMEPLFIGLGVMFGLIGLGFLYYALSRAMNGEKLF